MQLQLFLINWFLFFVTVTLYLTVTFLLSQLPFFFFYFEAETCFMNSGQKKIKPPIQRFYHINTSAEMLM